MNWVGQWYIYDCISSSFIPCQFLVNPSICGMWQSVKIHSAFPSGNHHGVDRFQQRMLEELHGKKNMFRNVFARASPLGRRHTQLGENWCGDAEKSASSLRLQHCLCRHLHSGCSAPLWLTHSFLWHKDCVLNSHSICQLLAKVPTTKFPQTLAPPFEVPYIIWGLWLP